MRNVTLRIKRVYLEQILDGSKDCELRSCTDFYERLLRDSKEIATITLHYQTERKVICDVVSVKRVKRPSHLDQSMLSTDRIFKISVKNPREVFEYKSTGFKSVGAEKRTRQR